MKNIFKIVTMIFFTFEAYAEDKKNLPKKLECAFLMERIKGGKPNEASCGHSSEEIFTSSGNSQYYPRAQLCDMGSVSTGHDFKNFIVDFDKNKISYDSIFVISDFYKPRMKKYYVKNGKSEFEADEIVNMKRKPNSVVAEIKSISVSLRDLYRDPITKERYKPIKKIKSFNVHYQDSIGKMHTLSYAENIPKTIITSFAGNSEYSWVNIRFGNCRMIN